MKQLKKKIMPIPHRTPPPPSKVKWFTPWYLPFSQKFASYVIKIRIEMAFSLTKIVCCEIASYKNQD